MSSWSIELIVCGVSFTSMGRPVAPLETRLARLPVTTTVCRLAFASCAWAGAIKALAASAQVVSRNLFFMAFGKATGMKERLS